MINAYYATRLACADEEEDRDAIGRELRPILRLFGSISEKIGLRYWLLPSGNRSTKAFSAGSPVVNEVVLVSGAKCPYLWVKLP